MSIRVIAGEAKGRRLNLVPGDTTRPIMDRAKEALFSILGEGIRDARFLDLFAGTGSVGIEALSRGAEHCLFVDKARGAIKTIRSNLVLTGFTERAEVLQADALELLRRTPTDTVEGFEYLYIAPPQYIGLWLQALQLLDTQLGLGAEWVYPDGVVVVQIDPQERQDVTLTQLRLYDERRYGNTLFLFYERPGE
jgi:16S rRNA (guanine966-N2)-methyltransferase